MCWEINRLQDGDDDLIAELEAEIEKELAKEVHLD